MNDDPQSMLDLSDFLDGIEKDEDLQGELDAERTLEQIINEIKKEINK